MKRLLVTVVAIMANQSNQAPEECDSHGGDIALNNSVEKIISDPHLVAELDSMSIPFQNKDTRLAVSLEVTGAETQTTPFAAMGTPKGPKKKETPISLLRVFKIHPIIMLETHKCGGLPLKILMEH